MKSNITKKGLVLITLILLIGSFVIPSISIEIKNSNKPLLITVIQSDDNIKITYELNDFDKIPVYVNGNQFYRILIGEEPNLLFEGMPDIPVICRSVIIPDNTKMTVSVIDSSFIEFNNIDIAPSKGNLLRNVNPDDVAYIFGDVYSVDDWFPGKICDLREPYILRDYRAQVVEVYPIQYNPVKRTMRFYTNIKINIYSVGIDSINCLNRDQFPVKVDSDFKTIYDNQFINYGKLSRYEPISEQGNMLIICYDDFMDEMQPFVEWKIMKGIPTEIVPVSEIGNANDIKTYISDYYNDNGLTFVLLVGDAAQVPTLLTGAGSDPSYTYIVGSDHYPDIFIGRFSAQNSDQVITQVERSIEYERDPQINAEWYHKGIGIGSDQGAGQGDEGQADWDHIRTLRTLLMNYTYTEVDEFYDGSHGGEDAAGSPSPSMISEAINDGRSIINYCGHGWQEGWGTSGFSNVNIDSLVNDNMLPYVTCVACNNGEFNDVDTCFCEAWLRATNNGEPTGAIVATGSTVSMSWAPPMDAQDEFVDLIVETYEDNIKHTFGGIHYNGVMHMNDDYGSGGFSETDYWTLFGDPSLTIRTDTPQEMSIVRDEEIKGGATSYEVTIADVENAYCAISRDGVILGSAYTDEFGYAVIEFNEPLIGDEPLTLVITGYNKIPCIAELPVITNEPPLTPSRPSGSSSGKPDVLLKFSTSTTDPEGNQVFYMWDWGDGNQSVWMGAYESGQENKASWTYIEPGTYSIKVKAKDTENGESDWSEPLTITVKKARNIQRLLLQYLLEKFPDFFRVIDQIIQKII
jgi:hypothetical protein